MQIKLWALAGAMGLTVSFGPTVRAAEQSDVPALVINITASCLPMPDLSVSDCRIEDSDVGKTDPILAAALRHVSTSRLPPDWKSTLKMQGDRVIIPFAMKLRKVG
ncbi:MAG TPA: hypothetical protein VN806_12630 [Caulobacteraceae bacterium]|nr:hypothetical protein [Caulobacteraceae bacterium]